MLQPSVIALLIPIIIFMIPIVAILTHHQRKMAEIMHRQGGTQAGELDRLSREVEELKHLVHQQAIALDTFLEAQRRTQATTARGDELQGRVS
ncbi:MAG TPA: hypothetical protein VM328_09355 [Fimbriimonadaceae bacterium]|nr:hypothetical protein [Fimbriimonadaceae bacterium]